MIQRDANIVSARPSIQVEARSTSLPHSDSPGARAGGDSPACVRARGQSVEVGQLGSEPSRTAPTMWR